MEVRIVKSFKIFSIAVVLLGYTVAASAQTLQDVTEARNKGVELMSGGDLNGAIRELEKCVELSKQVGEEAEEHLIAAQGALPNLYLQNAGKISDAKDYDAALKAFNETIAAAERYNNPDIKGKAEKALPDVYLAMGLASYQAKNYEAAIKAFDEAIQRNPELIRAYFTKGASYQMLKDEPNMVESYRATIEKGGDSSPYAKQAKGSLTKYFYNQGIVALQGKKTDDAVAAFTKAVEADDTNGDAYYRLSSCYNDKKQYDNAISNAEKALELKAGAGDAALAGIYFVLGHAYLAKKDNGKACENFKKAQHGPYADNAKYQIETVLKCK
jgi:tetratricopeptide (TPR) repeat protein